MKVKELKTGQRFRINRREYELVSPGPVNATVRWKDDPYVTVMMDACGDRHETQSAGAVRVGQISRESEVEEVIPKQEP